MQAAANTVTAEVNGTTQAGRSRPAPWPAVRGHVLSARVLERMGLTGRPIYTAEVRYLYNVNARTREGCWTGAPCTSRRLAEAIVARHPVGAKPWVSYNPEAPTETTLGAEPAFSAEGLLRRLRDLFA
jgi:hypothetical protein